MNNSSSKLPDNDTMSFILHQDNLMWNRLQTIGVIQIGALSAAYGVRNVTWLSLCILALGIILTILIFFLLKRDELQRMKIEKEFKKLDYHRVDRKWYAPLTGKEIAWILILTLLISDLVLGIAIITKAFDC